MLLRAAVITTVIVASGSAAHAELGITLNFNRMFIRENGGPLQQPSNANEATWFYFNKAHCTCSLKQPDFEQSQFAWEITPSAQTPLVPAGVSASVWVGTNCENLQTRPQMCVQLTYTGISSIQGLQMTNAQNVSPFLYDLMNPEPDAPTEMGCKERFLSSTTWLSIDENLDGTDDTFFSKAIDTDTEAPALPSGFVATGAENAIDITWDTPTGNITDIWAYQALCAREDGELAGVKSVPTARYQTASQLCGEADNFAFTISDIDSDDETAPVATPADGIGSYDPTFLCGDQPSPTATSLRIEGLENGARYQVAVIVVDKYGNPRGTFFNRLLQPKPATDFWEDLHERGSEVEGGFCLLAETYGDDSFLTTQLRAFRDETLADTAFGRWLTDVYYATLGKLSVEGSLALRIVAGIALLPLVAFALLWHFLTLPGALAALALAAFGLRRFRRRSATRIDRGAGRRLGVPTTAIATLAVLCIAAGGVARADDGGGFDPNWNEPGAGAGESQFAEDEGIVKWHVGVRVGPYTPQIDAQLGGMKPGPYEQMYGGYSILPMLDVERVIWDGHGQFLVGGNIGYIGKKARAWEDSSDPADPMRPRAKGDETKFRLVPFALTATYRWTYLDDEFGIPVVPYAKAGLAYYIWWMTNPRDDISSVCKDGSDTDGCEKNAGYGATPGFQGAIGLAIRAERIDRDAANSMREGGLLHAGFYGELQMAVVDGFGSDKKLSVGDTTWFAGVEFEF